MPLDTRDTSEYKLLFVTPSGREYLVTLIAMGRYHDKPPFVAWEQDDGFVKATLEDGKEMTYSSLEHLAGEHGCLRGDMVSVDPVN